MPARIYKTASEEETIALGQRLASELPAGVVLLIGNLGAGKTTLVKGIVSGLGAAAVEEVSSPTFTLIHEYGGIRGAPKVFHIDLYRLETEREVESLGLDDLFDSHSLVLIEWGERFPRLMPRRRTEIRLLPINDEGREIAVTYKTE
ncbi:MAG: tRNA (adenosine(37)-N6)-threonylcarbamoyltransferase complex ATPase subunit type 1 TsaE [Bryobacteraceae bacterium]